MSNLPLNPNFGIHQVTFKDIKDPSYWAMAHLLGSAEADLKPELIKLEGGSSPLPWGVAPGKSSGEITLTIKQYNRAITKFLAPWTDTSEIEDIDGESSGSITEIVNIVGSSIVKADTGIASVSIGNASSLAIGKYKVIATADATIDIYCDSDISGKVTYQDDSLKINDAAITIPSGDKVSFAGIDFNGGSGTIAMVAGDIASFEVRPKSNYLLRTYAGKAGSNSREFELTIYGECLNGRYRRTIYPRCVASASIVPSYLEKEWSMIEATVQVLKPAFVDYVAENLFINK